MVATVPILLTALLSTEGISLRFTDGAIGRIADFASLVNERTIIREAREQFLAAEERLPDVVVACVGGGSNAIGMFHPFIGDAAVEIIGIEAGGTGQGLGQNAATLAYGRPAASDTAAESIIAPSTMLSGGIVSTPMAPTLYPLPAGLSSIALTALDEVIAAADEAGIAMLFTGMRHFRH